MNWVHTCHIVRCADIDAKIDRWRRKLSADIHLKDGVGMSVYQTRMPDVWIRTLGVLDDDIVEALNLVPYIVNSPPIKPFKLHVVTNDAS